jgi:hypothetical protein
VLLLQLQRVQIYEGLHHQSLQDDLLSLSLHDAYAVLPMQEHFHAHQGGLAILRLHLHRGLQHGQHHELHEL